MLKVTAAAQKKFNDYFKNKEQGFAIMSNLDLGGGCSACGTRGSCCS